MHYWIVNLFDFSTELSALSCLTFQTSQVVKIKGLFVMLSVTADKTLGLRVNGDVDSRVITLHCCVSHRGDAQGMLQAGKGNTVVTRDLQHFVMYM